jgi:hypothetical protein
MTLVVLGSINMDLVVEAPRLPLAGETLRGSHDAPRPARDSDGRRHRRRAPGPRTRVGVLLDPAPVTALADDLLADLDWITPNVG